MFFSLVPMLLSAPSSAHQNVIFITQNGNAIVQAAEKPGTRIEFDEDQAEDYRAVQKGYIRPFSELYEAVENDLYGRIIKVEFEEEDNEWKYELTILFINSVLKVEYAAVTLEKLQVKGRNFNKALK
ncbi:membrane protein, partial [Vibrio parahaemolyticus]